jgi:hypothetical protein
MIFSNSGCRQSRHIHLSMPHPSTPLVPPHRQLSPYRRNRPSRLQSPSLVAIFFVSGGDWQGSGMQPPGLLDGGVGKHGGRWRVDEHGHPWWPAVTLFYFSVFQIFSYLIG